MAATVDVHLASAAVEFALLVGWLDRMRSNRRLRDDDLLVVVEAELDDVLVVRHRGQPLAHQGNANISCRITHGWSSSHKLDRKPRGLSARQFWRVGFVRARDVAGAALLDVRDAADDLAEMAVAVLDDIGTVAADSHWLDAESFGKASAAKDEAAVAVLDGFPAKEAGRAHGRSDHVEVGMPQRTEAVAHASPAFTLSLNALISSRRSRII